MSKRKHVLCEPSSPRSGHSDEDELHITHNDSRDLPLLPLRPPSVGSEERLSFGSVCVDGVPVSLPVPRPLHPDEVQSKVFHSMHGPGTVSPTAVTAAPLSKAQANSVASQQLAVIPEAEEAEPSEHVQPEADSTSPIPTTEELQPRPREPSESPPLTSTPAVTAAKTAPSASERPSRLSTHEDASCSLKRRKSSRDRDDADPESPERVRHKSRAVAYGELDVPSVSAEDEDEENIPEEPVQTDVAGVVGAVTASNSGKRFKLNLSVDLPPVSSSMARFGGIPTPHDEGLNAPEAPLLPLRPPSVSGCPELLRFGGDGVDGVTPSLPVPPVAPPTEPIENQE